MAVKEACVFSQSLFNSLLIIYKSNSQGKAIEKVGNKIRTQSIENAQGKIAYSQIFKPYQSMILCRVLMTKENEGNRERWKIEKSILMNINPPAIQIELCNIFICLLVQL